MTDVALKLTVQKILESPLSYEWSLQGLGMLRLYLSKEVRLHVWSKPDAVPGVSELHDHPWDFSSVVVAGRLVNWRYRELAGGNMYSQQTLRCGPGGCRMGDPTTTCLKMVNVERLEEGQGYKQRHNEIHRSDPEDGTVTIITRAIVGDGEHARVFWPLGAKWVSAEPRPATAAEVLGITRAALGRWFK